MKKRFSFTFVFLDVLIVGFNLLLVGPSVQAAVPIVLAAGGTSSLARMSNGTVRAWGWNQYGQLGNGDKSSSNSPVPVVGLTGVSAVAAGNSFGLALKSDGTVWSGRGVTMGSVN